MPASPSFPSGTRGSRWKRRKREATQLSRRHKDAVEDEDEDEDPNDLDDDVDRAAEDPDAEDTNPSASNHNHNHSHAAADPSPRETEVLSDGGVRICDFPPVVKRAVNRPHSSVLGIVALERANSVGEGRDQVQGGGVCLENVSYGQLQALSAVPADSPGLADSEKGDGDAPSFVATPPSIMEGMGVVKRFGSRVHVVPMHSDWFSPSTVHRLERQVVPHFFSGKSVDHTPEKYMECRNYIVAKYMDNPYKRLRVSDCQGLVIGIQDDDLNRIVRFLDHWGIINYCAASAPPRESWNGGSYLKEDQSGEVHVPSAALKSIDSLIKFEKPKCRRKAADLYSSSSHKDDRVSDLDNRIRELLSGNCCSHCSRPLLVVYYQSHKEVDVYLCSDCYHEGRFVIGHSSIDFTRVDSTKIYDDLDGENWTNQETLLLLEGVEQYTENWNEIAEYVGTKSKAQCILHFLRLPMENGILENIEVPGASLSSGLSNGDDQSRQNSNVNGEIRGSCHQDTNSEDRLPFANSGNPVMALVSFLASAVAPRVAAACAHASLAVLSAENGVAESGNIIQVEGSAQGHRMNLETSQAGDSVQQEGNQDEADGSLLSPEKVQAAAKAGLAAAATKAKLFADHEEREIQRLSANIINHQLKRLELKLKQFAEVETLLMKECEQVEKTRQRLAAERMRIISTRFGATGVTSHAGVTGVASPMANSSSGNPRQAVISASPSQLSNPGYATNQQIPPHMPFIQQRQAVFPLGPRLPLSAINSSSAPSSSTAFNAPGNSQPSLNHQMLRSVPGTNSSLG
ncbi:hypothetical protein ACJRO7_025632 [Eucalyptus globulus]|uniref:SWI/SNF complex subunit SWI3C n=2 Tax=Eucalyptus globulus TaxID=34317 RepID=A0ABD3KED0_EUCGL